MLYFIAWLILACGKRRIFLEENCKTGNVGFPIFNLMAKKAGKSLWNVQPGTELYPSY